MAFIISAERAFAAAASFSRLAARTLAVAASFIAVAARSLAEAASFPALAADTWSWAASRSNAVARSLAFAAFSIAIAACLLASVSPAESSPTYWWLAARNRVSTLEALNCTNNSPAIASVTITPPTSSKTISVSRQEWRSLLIKGAYSIASPITTNAVVSSSQNDNESREDSALDIILSRSEKSIDRYERTNRLCLMVTIIALLAFRIVVPIGTILWSAMRGRR